MISDKELEKLQNLSKLDFSKKDLAKFSASLENVVTMIDQLRDVDCENVEPLRSVCDMHQRFFEDEVGCDDISGDLFRNIPEKGAKIAKEVKCFVVPKVIE